MLLFHLLLTCSVGVHIGGRCCHSALLEACGVSVACCSTWEEEVYICSDRWCCSGACSAVFRWVSILVDGLLKRIAERYARGVVGGFLPAWFAFVPYQRRATLCAAAALNRRRAHVPLRGVYHAGLAPAYHRISCTLRTRCCAGGAAHAARRNYWWRTHCAAQWRTLRLDAAKHYLRCVVAARFASCLRRSDPRRLLPRCAANACVQLPAAKTLLRGDVVFAQIVT